MGEVYEGWDEALERRVAVKCLKGIRRSDRINRARFLQEARLLSKLDHPNICQIHDLVREDDHDYLILELIDGRSLRDRVKDRPSHRAKLKIALQIARVLEAAHAEGVVHRDLKPDNVMITDDDHVKVLDFGIAHSMGSELGLADTEVDRPSGDDDEALANSVHTRLGAVLGTPRYMSPEQARGDRVTPASDMYSFGIILHELFTGDSPYGDQPSRRELLVAVSDGQTRPVRGVSRQLADLVRRLESVNPADRPTATVAHERLQQVAGRPRRLALRAVAALVAAAAAAAAGKYTLDLDRERAAAVAARNQAESLVTFMLADLAEELAPLGRLAVLDKVGRRVLQHYATAPSDLVPEAAFNRGRAFTLASSILAERGDRVAALQAARGAVAVHRDVVAAQPTVTRWQDGLAVALLQEVAVLTSVDDGAAARQALSEARRLAAAAVEAEPDVNPWRRTLAETWYSEGLLAMFADGAPDPAPFLEAISRYEDLARRDPHGHHATYRLAVLHGQGLGQVYSALGRDELSLAAVSRALELYRSLLAADPANTRWQFGYAWELRRWAEHMEDQGRLDQALAAYRETLAISQRLEGIEPTKVAWQQATAIDHAALARVLSALGQSAPARVELDLALERERLMVALEPTAADPACSLAEDLLLSAGLPDRQGDAARARVERLEALALLDAVPVDGRQEPWCEELRVRALVELGRGAEAAGAVAGLVAAGRLRRGDGSDLDRALTATGSWPDVSAD